MPQAQINVQSSAYLESSSWGWGSWSSNQASLCVAPGATFGLTDNQVVVDALTGGGTIRQDWYLSDPSQPTLVVGIANGSGEFSGVIEDNGFSASLFKAGGGIQTLSGSNSYSGGTSIGGGTLQIGNGASGEGLASPSISNSSALVFNHADTLTYAGAISGTGSLTKTGSGTLILTGASNYSGNTMVNGGALAVNGSLNGSGIVAVSGGGAQRQRHCRQSLRQFRRHAGSRLNPKRGNAQRHDLDAPKRQRAELHARRRPGRQRLCQREPGRASLPAIGVTLNILDSTLSTGTYPLFGYASGGLSGLTANTFTIGAKPASVAGDSFTFNDTGSVLDLVIAAASGAPINGVWTTGVSGSWSESGKWTGGVPGSGQDTATFNATPSGGTAMVTLDASRSLASLGFSTSSGSGYTIAAAGTSTLTLANLGGSATISNSGGSQTIPAPIVLGSNLNVTAAPGSVLSIAGSILQTGGSQAVSLSGGGALILSGTSGYTGGTNVDGSVLAATAASALPSSGLMTIGSGGRLVLGGGSGIGALLGASSPISSGAVALSAARSAPAILGGFGSTSGNMATLGGASRDSARRRGKRRRLLRRGRAGAGDHRPVGGRRHRAGRLGAAKEDGLIASACGGPRVAVKSSLFQQVRVLSRQPGAIQRGKRTRP